MAFPLYLDEDSMNRKLVVALLAAGMNCLTTSAAGRGRNQQSDLSQLEYATSLGRSVITSNQRDFYQLHTEWISSERPHAGIIIITRQITPVGVILAKLRESQVRTAEEMRDAILFLSARPLQDSSS